MVRTSVLRGVAWGQALSPLGGASLCVAVPIPQEKTGGRERRFRPFRFSLGGGGGGLGTATRRLWGACNVSD